jgi:hypothetical protein
MSLSGTFVAATNLEGTCGLLQIDGCPKRAIAAMHANIASCFPPPWSVEDNGACFIVRDHSGKAVSNF